MAESAGKVKVLYIAGSGRSGSTILGNMLGSVEGWFHGGELAYLWRRGAIRNRDCGCGSPFAGCELWSSIMRELARGGGSVAAEEVDRFVRSTFGLAEMLTALRDGGRKRLRKRFRHVLDHIERLYHAMAQVTGASVLVDGSKQPRYASILSLLDSIDIRMVHLVRDPRAVVHSWQRKKAFDPKKEIYFPRMSATESTYRWIKSNAGVEMVRLRRRDMYRLLRYEDLVEEPAGTLRAIGELVGVEADRLPTLTDGAVTISMQHTVSGNPVRFATGPVRLRRDDEWMTAVLPATKRIVALATCPLLLRYGYR